MCFDQPTSYGFAAFGLALAIYSNHALKAKGGRAARGADRFSTGVFYFVTMEALQGMSYSYIDQCGPGDTMNQLLTVLGFAHICGQPYFTHLMSGAFYNRQSTNGKENDFAMRLALLAGLLFFMRYPLAVYAKTDLSFLPAYEEPQGTNYEWLRATSSTPGGANTTCTYTGTGQGHLAWTVPMYQPSYFSPSVFLHAFVMFAPFAVARSHATKLFGFFLWLSGPYLSTVLTADVNEQAAVWCFMSICQITLMFVGVMLSTASSSEGAKAKGKAAPATEERSKSPKKVR